VKEAVRWKPLGIPLAAAVAVAAAGWWGNRVLVRSMQGQLREHVQAILDADVTALRLWVEDHRRVAVATAGRADVRRLVGEIAGGGVRRAAAAAELGALLDPVAREFGYAGWGVVSPDLRVLAAAREEAVGGSMAGGREWIEPVLAGDARVSKPLPGDSILAGGVGGEPTLFAAAPVAGAAGEVVAALGFRIPADEFTRILGVARMGESGETYAFDAEGLMVSHSRFDEQLRAIGLLPADPGVHSILNVEIRNPGGDMTRGFVPEVPLRARPLTRMAADAIAGRPGVDVAGYPDYRGVPVVGAWTWLPEMGLGVATEVDVAEAYAALFTLRRAFWALLGLLGLGAAGILVYSIAVGRLQRKVERAREMGQYRLIRKIGEGGMGQVYLAEHAMLRRPTAVKMIKGGETDEVQLKRFEREVQFTSQLTHPNTIRVFDYGRTPDGVFYYAMEYLEGITLTRAVEAAGPLPEERVIHVLAQLCGSLAEAHAAGLIHRDIKPTNVILCERGGIYDFVKVLDFGLVRRMDQSQTALTGTQTITGTPLYISPEAITAPGRLDARADLYSVAGVGYYLLTGRPVFEGDAFEVCGQHVHSRPEPPSKRLGRPVAEDLEGLLMRCLAKDPAARPPDAGAMLAALERCRAAGAWTQERARDWWEQELQWSRIKGSAEAAPATPRSTDVPALEIDMEGRAPAPPTLGR
jgi:tRNA A-37 threonylcarbamoyl transferase component Bud32